MARKSASSSTTYGNGHSTSAEPSVDAPIERLASGIRHEWTNDEHNDEANGQPTSRPPPATDSSLYPGARRSLSSIGLQAFALGFVLSTSLSLTTLLLFKQLPLWRLPAFFICLSLFHFLEYWTTAQYNTPATRASSFLLFSNGAAYNIAHTLATLEILISNFFPHYQSYLVGYWTIALGIALVILGQTTRSFAMAQAGTNFNHLPAKTKQEGHVLVSEGVYSWLRHPSYFGFFWWALGTQVLVGNKVCLVGYLIALWKFFHSRVKAEEVTLVQFFGQDYEAYRKRTGTGIPFVR